MLPWLLAVLSPLLAAGIIPVMPSARQGKWLLVLAPLPALALALFADLHLDCELDTFLLGTHLGFGLFDRTFLLLTALAWSVSALFIACGRGKRLTTGFLSMFALTMGGNIGLTAAQDVVSFYTFFALMTFAAYSLVIHTQTEKARRAGRIYLFMAVCAEGLLIAGFMLAVFHSPSHYFTDIAPAMAALPPSHPVFWCFFAGFGVKAGIIFFHFWLPLAHPVAPTPASAVLSAAMIKAGLLGWLHFFPLGAVSFPAWGAGFMVLGLGSAFFGALAGLGESSPKTVLAYSSISQMGLMSFALGLGLYDQTLWSASGPGLQWLIITHALAKTTLFLGVAVIGASRVRAAWKKCILGGLCLPGLALAGAPFTAGDQAKYVLKKAAEAGPGGDLGTALLFLSSLMTTMLIGHFLRLVWQLPAREKITSAQVWSWGAGILLVTSLPAWFPIVTPELKPHGFFSPSPSALVPIAAGLLLYLLAQKPMLPLIERIQKLGPDPAAGMDLIWHKGTGGLRQSSLIKARWMEMNVFTFLDQAIRSDFGWERMRHVEYRAAGWPVFGFWFILLILILAGWVLL
jgi:formate hydrogenlyase subunit 3/multisubunit Na+/H+ antiporter MnhD subunit